MPTLVISSLNTTYQLHMSAMSNTLHAVMWIWSNHTFATNHYDIRRISCDHGCERGLLSDGMRSFSIAKYCGRLPWFRMNTCTNTIILVTQKGRNAILSVLFAITCDNRRMWFGVYCVIPSKQLWWPMLRALGL